ncbi:hypothetical protein L596_010805 [Steinernema carpocapsae]|uniref:Phospholipase A2 domain-containing protein n=1 Tax=Steinernema carpocapsae TaxID=34508 RepID=A0A4V6A700_STECR|nr:hypothetical protein L596_010805 [Steinernema carpocapsae]
MATENLKCSSKTPPKPCELRLTERTTFHMASRSLQGLSRFPDFTFVAAGLLILHLAPCKTLPPLTQPKTVPSPSPMCFLTSSTTFFLITTMLSVAYGIRNASEFHCGNSKETTEMAFTYVNESCPERIYEANDCCVAHDDCYLKQLGQAHCDHVFCECLDVMVAQGARDGECHSVKEWYCFTVSMFGHDAYIASAPEATNTTEETRKEDSETPEKEKEDHVPLPNHCGFKNSLSLAFYDAISSHCPQNSDSFHSCCIDHNKCILDSEDDDACHADFCSCIEASVDDRHSCIFASAGFCRSSFSGRAPPMDGSRNVYLENHTHVYGYSLLEVALLTFLWVSISFAIGSAAFCTLGRLQKTWKKVEQISPPLMYNHLRDSERSVV